MTGIADSESPLAIDPPLNEYSWDFDYGLGPWTTWLAPSVVNEAGGLYENFTRLNAPGNIDPNHVDGIGALRLVAHLSIPVTGSAGVMDLTNGEFQITIRGTDFEANGAKLVVWLTRYVPEEGVLKNYYVALTVTNWANTGNDIAAQLTDEWQTITVSLSDDPADWTYAGTNNSQQGDWGDRYQPVDLADVLAYTDATLHLVMVSDEPDQAPTGFLDIANITVRTQTPAAGLSGVQPEGFYGLEDQVTAGVLAGDPSVDMASATFSLVNGSNTNGVVTIDPATGAFSFTPNANFFGPTDFVGRAGFTYRVTDGATTVEHTAFLFIGPVNDAPTASVADEAVDIAFGQPFSFSLFRGQDVDADERLTYHLVDDGATNGTVTLDTANGRYVFTPNPGFTGTASFSYYVSDGQLDSAPKTVTLTVHAENDPPPTVTYDQAVDFLIAGDSQTFAYHVIQLAQAGDLNAAYHYGTFLGSGRFVPRDAALSAYYLSLAVNFIPDANLQLVDRYLTGDGVDKDYGQARALLEALPNNATALYRLGLLENLGFGGPRDEGRAVELYLQAASMGNADAMYTVGRRYLMAEGVAYSASDAYFWLAVGLRLNGGPPGIPQFDNLLLFNMNQAAENLTVAEREALDAAAAAWVPGAAVPVNDAPVAGEEADINAGSTNIPVSGTLAAGSDPDGNRLTYSLVGGSAQNGTVVIDALTGGYVFTPASGYVGPASFRYVVSDGQAASVETTVNLSFDLVTAAGNDTGELTEASSLTVDAVDGLLANDNVSAVGGEIHIASVNGQAADVGRSVTGTYGSITIAADGSYTYVANGSTATLVDGQTVTDSFTYTIVDGQNVSSTATVTLTIVGAGRVEITGSGVIIGGDYGEIITGGSGADTILGQGGDDLIDGGDGAANEIYGGTGNDTFVVRVVGDTIIENPGEGIDTVQTALASYTLRDNIENLVFTGSGSFEGTGNGGDNTLTGGSGADLLYGLEGDDTLDGGAGDDLMVGGLGNDTYIVADSGDSVVEAANEGTDTVRTSLSSYQLGAHVENLIYTGGGAFNGSGNSLDNVITGGIGNDILAGGAGTDILNGGAGNDTADYSTAASGVRAQLNTNASSNDGDGGTDTFISIENLTGSAFNDILIGDAGGNVLRGGLGADVLIGLAGNDVLWGGAGALNTLQGGTGDDLYVLEAADSVVEFEGEGIDTVDARINTYVLANNVENLLFGGTGDFRGTGNALDNVITGGAGNDVLRGGGGMDVLNGGAGNDTVDYTLAASGVVARLDSQRATNDGDGSSDTFSSIENLIGSNYNDLLIGDNNANVLMGGIGTDILLGFGGDDILMGGSGGGNNQMQGGTGNDWYILDAFDTCVEFADEGIDTVEARIGSYTLGANIENLLYTGPGKFVGSGNALDNHITGGNLDDILRGGGGNDTILGGLGNDEVQLRGDLASYTITAEGAGYRIVDSVAGRDGSTYVESIERLRFSGDTVVALTYETPAASASTDKTTADNGLVTKGTDGPQILPASVDDDFLPIKGFDGPMILPAAIDDDGPTFAGGTGDLSGRWVMQIDSDASPLAAHDLEGSLVRHDHVVFVDLLHAVDPWG